MGLVTDILQTVAFVGPLIDLNDRGKCQLWVTSTLKLTMKGGFLPLEILIPKIDVQPLWLYLRSRIQIMVDQTYQRLAYLLGLVLSQKCGTDLTSLARNWKVFGEVQYRYGRINGRRTILGIGGAGLRPLSSVTEIAGTPKLAIFKTVFQSVKTQILT